jgi:hypothetical protein
MKYWYNYIINHDLIAEINFANKKPIFLILKETGPLLGDLDK